MFQVWQHPSHGAAGSFVDYTDSKVSAKKVNLCFLTHASRWYDIKLYFDVMSFFITCKGTNNDTYFCYTLVT